MLVPTRRCGVASRRLVVLALTLSLVSLLVALLLTLVASLALALLMALLLVPLLLIGIVAPLVGVSGLGARPLA